MAPSDMMDGRIACIKGELAKKGFGNKVRRWATGVGAGTPRRC